MGRKLVAYFSATGVTKEVAERLSEASGADLLRIRPEVPYTKEDLDWMNPRSRSSVEMKDHFSRPKMIMETVSMEEYNTIFLGFPIWWYVAPTIINTFLEAYDLKGKTIIPFATSGGSDMGETNMRLRGSCPDSRLLEGRVFKKDVSKVDLLNWEGSLRLI